MILIKNILLFLRLLTILNSNYLISEYLHSFKLYFKYIKIWKDIVFIDMNNGNYTQIKFPHIYIYFR